MNTLKYHNPDKVNPEQVGEGWRLCLKSEIQSPPKDAEFWDTVGWAERAYCDWPLQNSYTYRTRVPLPKGAADPYAELKAAHAAGKTIQNVSLDGTIWHDTDNPRWMGGPENYRIKPEEPEPPVVRVAKDMANAFNCPPIKIGKEVPPSQEEAALAAKMQEALSEKPPVISDGTPEGCLPFDLEKAKAGAPLITRDGREAKFIAHVPEAKAGQRLLCLMGEYIGTRYENGRGNEVINGPEDLFIRAPRKVKREAWIAVSKSALAKWSRPSFDAAKAHADRENEKHGRVDLVPARVEWEEDEK